MGKGMALHLNKLKSPSPKEALCEVWLKLAQCFLRGYFLSKYFPYLVVNSSWERVWHFIGTNLNPFHPRRHCAKFDLYWPSGS